MTERASGCARAMEEILAAYRKATADLLESIRQLDDPGTARGVAERADCIERYRGAVADWNILSERERDASLLETRDWHLRCIKEEDDGAIARIQSIQVEIGAELSRLGQVRKVDRAYQSPAGEKSRIVSGEG